MILKHKVTLLLSRGLKPEVCNKSSTAMRRPPTARRESPTVRGTQHREGGLIWENGIETCIISYMKRVTSPGSNLDNGCLGLVHWDTQRVGMGREEGGGYRVRNTCIPVVDSC